MPPKGSSVTQQLALRQAVQRASRSKAVAAFGDMETAQYSLVDFAKVQQPRNVYAADRAWVEVDGLSFLLMFWQPLVIGDGADTAIVVKMHLSYLRRFISSVDEMHEPGLQAICKQHAIEPAVLQPLTVNPRQLARFHANIPNVAVSGHETCIDFYEASPFAFVKAKSVKGGQLDLDAIVRINLDTGLFVGLCLRAKKLIAEFPEEMGAAA